jgi:hypothetical protein
VALQGVLTKRATFLHFGSLTDFIDSASVIASSGLQPFYSSDEPELPVEVNNGAIMNCCHEFCTSNPGPLLVEGCLDSSMADGTGASLVCGIEKRTTTMSVPEELCLDERRTPQGVFRLVYGLNDTWTITDSIEDLRFCGQSFLSWLSDRDLKVGEILPETDVPDLLNAELFLADISDDDLKAYWDREAANSE